MVIPGLVPECIHIWLFSFPTFLNWSSEPPDSKDWVALPSIFLAWMLLVIIFSVPVSLIFYLVPPKPHGRHLPGLYGNVWYDLLGSCSSKLEECSLLKVVPCLSSLLVNWEIQTTFQTPACRVTSGSIKFRLCFWSMGLSMTHFLLLLHLCYPSPLQ